MKSRPILRIALLIVALAITLIALFYTYTNWHGARAWKKTETRLRTLGEPLTIAEITPEPIPDELNFAAAPIFADIFDKPKDEWRISEITGFRGASEKGSSDIANFARSVNPDFNGSDEDAARVVLAEAARSDELWREIREAAIRPAVWWSFDLSDPTAWKINHVTMMIVLAQSLQAQALAHCVAGDSLAAFDDFELVLDLADKLTPPNVLISHLVRMSLVAMATSIVSHGIDLAAWTDVDLARIQTELARIDLLSSCQHALKTERLVFLEALARFDKSGFPQVRSDETVERSSFAEYIGAAVWKARPNGWIFEDRIYMVSVIDDFVEALAEPTTAPGIKLAIADDFERRKKSPLEVQRAFFSLMAVPALLSSFQKSLHIQAQIDQTIVACAIERYRLSRGHLPAALVDLVPEYLPTKPLDRLSGEPMIYRVESPTEYVLYGVGWNQRDDGGSSKKPSPKAFDQAEDWVWRAQ